MPLPAISSETPHIREVFSSIQGEGYLAGRRQIFVRFSGCNLDCAYCDEDNRQYDTCRVEVTPGKGVFREIGQEDALGALPGIITDWQSRLPGAHHSISITGGEPLLHAEELAEHVPILRKLLPVHLETNGTMHLSLERVLHSLDYISMDMKLPSTSGCTGELREIHRNFLSVAAWTNVSVKAIVSSETTHEEILDSARIIKEVRPNIPLFLQPVTLCTGMTGISAGRLLELQATGASIISDVRVIPQMHKMIGAR